MSRRPRDHRHPDVSPRALSLASAVLIGLVLFGMGVSLVLERVLTRYSRDLPAPLSHPGPALETEPRMAMERRERSARQRLARYGWVDRERGIAHLPIEEAMARLAEHGGKP